MEQQNKPSLLEKVAKLLAIPGFFLALFSVGWQVHTYRESHEESPMVRGSLTQEFTTSILKGFNRDKHGKLTIDITNLGSRTMLVKNVTVSAFNRVWIIRAPQENKPTLPLETGQTLSNTMAWDYSKYPIFEMDESEPADFLVQVETTRTVHQQHVHISTITVTSTIPSH
jgi:hypothetical protein